MPKYILIITAVLVVCWILFAFLAPSGSFGLTDFQMGQLAGRGTAYTMVIGIIAWVIARGLAKGK